MRNVNRVEFWVNRNPRNNSWGSDNIILFYETWDDEHIARAEMLHFNDIILINNVPYIILATMTLDFSKESSFKEADTLLFNNSSVSAKEWYDKEDVVLFLSISQLNDEDINEDDIEAKFMLSEE